MWALCISHVDRHDPSMVERWKSDMDGILIYTGVFCTTVAAFLIEAYKTLKPDPSEISSRLLRQATQELAFIANGERYPFPTADPSESEPFEPKRWAVHVNILWFLSLCLSLFCGLIALLVQQWVRRYLRLTQRADTPLRRVRVRTFLFDGMQDFHIRWAVENVSVLLHAAIFLFFAGLVEFLFAVNNEVAHVILAVVCVFAVIYIVITALPVIYRQCPFQTPLTSGLWYLSRIISIISLSPGSFPATFGRRSTGYGDKYTKVSIKI
ncbi:hypothetical protein BC826DRAFT_907152 [Russula brevipes]|nr:hypothetical protein BC826DRAFT_907152 [Russula brevipes]